jgi:hypothetical protein
MFLGKLLLVFLLIPILLVVVAIALPLDIRLWFLFVAFPAALILFALWRHLTETQKAGGSGLRGVR